MIARIKEITRIAYLWLHYHIPPVLRFRDLLHDWDRFCEADPAMREELQRLQQHSSDPRTILILVMDPYWQMSRLEYLVAAGFVLRGHRVKMVVADQLPAHASERVTAYAPPESYGLRFAARLLKKLGLEFQYLSDFFSDHAREKWESFVGDKRMDELLALRHGEVNVGKLVKATLLNYFLANRLDWSDPVVVARFRKSMVSALMALEAVQAIDAQTQPWKVFFNNGGVLPHYVILQYFLSRHIDTVTWEQPPTVEGRTLFISHDAISTKVTFDDWWQQHATLPLHPKEQEFLERHILKREKGTETYRVFTDPIEDKKTFLQTLGILEGKPIVSLYTNLAYDSAVVDVDTIFPDMIDWVLKTIDFFAAHPQHPAHLVIRIHPIEKILEESPARAPQQRVLDVIQRAYPILPPNVSVIPSESQLSSYTLMGISSLGVVYNSTVAFELAMRGTPVLACAEAAYNRKGFTIEPSSQEAYFEVLDQGSWSRLTGGQQMLAQKALYALTISIIRDQFFENLFDARGRRRIHVIFDSLNDLKPGRNRYLDMFFDAIIEKKPFRNITIEQILHDDF